MTDATAIPESRRQYVPTVTTFLPGVQDEELDVRCSLLLMRDCAMAAKGSCSEEAWTILDHVERLTSRFAFQGMPLDHLVELRRVLRLIVAAAASLDDWASPRKDAGARG